MQKTIDDLDFTKGDGLIPVIVQDVNTKEVLTLAYTNKESLSLTQKTGNSWFWSRSRNKLWMKGEESGNVQKVKEILVDCDSDAIVYLVAPTGPACHTGERVCFHHKLD
jgi:phosphoribosyl-AMP cyclohydrolase